MGCSDVRGVTHEGILAPKGIAGSNLGLGHVYSRVLKGEERGRKGRKRRRVRRTSFAPSWPPKTPLLEHSTDVIFPHEYMPLFCQHYANVKHIFVTQGNAKACG